MFINTWAFYVLLSMCYSCTPWDIIHVKQSYCQFMHALTLLHWKIVKHILHYFERNYTSWVYYSLNPYLYLYRDLLMLTRHLIPMTISPPLGFVYIFFGGNPVSQCSKKKYIIYRPRTKVEYRCLAAAATELAIWLRSLLYDLHITL